MENYNNNSNETNITDEIKEILKHTKITKEEMENAKDKIISEAKYLKKYTERSKNTKHIHTNIYWLLIKPFTYLNAYGNLSRNKGAMTPGIDGKSISGFSWNECIKLAEKIKTQTFEPTPVKRIWIDKPGKKEKRPLGIPNIQDRIVQEAVRGILEAIYEPIFQETYKDINRKVENFGFRPNLGCWDAIERIVNMGQGINQVIEGDIKGAYDNVDHEILLKLLNKKIKDKKLLNLINKFLKSGIMDKGEYRHSLLGVPQGGILSPLLYNIYMLELDIFIAEIFKKWEKKNEFLPKTPNKSPLYQRILYKNKKIREEYQNEKNPEKKKELRKEFKKQNRILFQTESYNKYKLRKKFIYIRYADDWIMGFSGTKQEANEIKEIISEFLSNTLKLNLSTEKTKITNIRKNFVPFLGYNIIIRANYNRTKKTVIRLKTPIGWNAIHKRTTSGKYYVIPNKERIMKNLTLKGFCKGEKHFPVGIRAWANLTEYQIVQKYRSIFIGLIQHYKKCDNLKILNRISYILQYSCAKTIATRQKTTISKIFQKYGKNLEITTTIKKNKEGDTKTIKIKFNTLTDLKDSQTMKGKPGLIKEWDPFKTITFWRTKFKTLTYCTVCGSTENIQMHHTNSIKKIGKKVTGFNLILQQLNRKQIPVCKTYHEKITAGKYNSIKISELYDEELAKF